MSDYTPDTEDVRDRYFECANWAAYEIQTELAIREETSAEFDRWLAEVKAQERMRIKEIINKETFHYGKTHYEGINCVVCRIYTRIDNDK